MRVLRPTPPRGGLLSSTSPSAPSTWALPVLVALLTAGCLQGLDPASTDDTFPEVLDLTLVKADGTPAALALVEAHDDAGTTLWLASTDLDGTLRGAVAPGVDRLVAYVDGAAYRVAADGSLEAAGSADAPVAMMPRVELPNPTFPVQLGTTCTEKADGDTGCGLDEPTVVVDGRGYVYYTAACCFLVSSPVWVSKDGGATFEPLEHPVKDAYGNEGDLAIDDEGNVYYMDIDLATFGITVWTPDGDAAASYRRPGEPLVDRPWIRAGADGVVHAIYNTGADTVHYRSTDHATTFSAVPVARYGSALAGAYSDPDHGIVGMLGYGEYMESTDGGATWGERQKVEGCTDAEPRSYAVESAAVDEAGTVWHQRSGCVVGRTLDGNWTAPSQAIPDGITPFFTWNAAGAAGASTVAYYGQVTDAARAERLGVETDGWYLFISFTTDGGAHWATKLADPDPVGFGDLGRRLGDFMTVAVGPEGGIHVAYSMNPEMDDSATATYIRTTPVPGMAPATPLVGPRDA